MLAGVLGQHFVQGDGDIGGEQSDIGVVNAEWGTWLDPLHPFNGSSKRKS